jgi:peptidoglycan/xylan/chitin deacetylase (PgdA/CDA1 family)
VRCREIWAVVAGLALVGCGGSHALRPAPPRPTASASPTPDTTVQAVAARARIPVLCYHLIRSPTRADAGHARRYIVRPSVFAAQMRTLAQAGYTTVTGNQFVDHLARGTPLPRKPVLLTFDDGSAGQYTHAFPVLRRHHFKATFFIITGVLGKPGWLTSEQVRALDRAGMTIGAHTREHKPVTRYTSTDWQTEVTAHVRDLEQIVGHRIGLFAYPFGLYESEAIPHLRRAGLRAAFQVDRPLDRRYPMWTIRRIVVPEISGRQLLREIRPAQG